MGDIFWIGLFLVVYLVLVGVVLPKLGVPT